MTGFDWFMVCLGAVVGGIITFVIVYIAFIYIVKSMFGGWL